MESSQRKADIQDVVTTASLAIFIITYITLPRMRLISTTADQWKAVRDKLLMKRTLFERPLELAACTTDMMHRITDEVRETKC